MNLAMPVTLSIRNVPADLVALLEKRARRHGQSLQAELLALIEATARDEERLPLGPSGLLDAARAAGISSRGDSTALIRRMRDERQR
jgi:plasmid stability protein